MRWQQLDFVVGIEIKLSDNHTCLGKDGLPHPFSDICDELAGRYPKTFKFTGWHPHCRCHAETILKTPEEMAADTQRILDGEETNTESENEIKQAPNNFTEWGKANKDRIKVAKKKGSLPYFLKDNPDFITGKLKKHQTVKKARTIGKIAEDESCRKKQTVLEAAVQRHSKRTPTSVDKIKKKWRNSRSGFYSDKVNNLLTGMKYYNADEEQLGKYSAIYARFQKVLSAINNGDSVADIKMLFSKVERAIHIQEEWDKDIWKGFTKEQIENCHEIEKGLKILKGRRMSIEDADKQSANPNYYKDKTYRINCQTCVPTYQLRLWGFDITAKAKTPGSLSEYLSRQHSFEAWRNMDGSVATPILTRDWMLQNGYTKMTRAKWFKYIDEACPSEGTYLLTVGWKKGGGHATIIQRDKNGLLHRIEPQIYNGYSAKRPISEIAGNGSDTPIPTRGILRIDDKLFVTKFLPIFDTK